MRLNRRKLLKTVGVSGGVVLTGCLGSGGSGGNGDSTEQGTTEGSDAGTEGTTTDGSDGGTERATTQSSGADTVQGTTSGGGGNSYHIGFAIMGLGGDPWMGAFRKGAEWYAEDKGLKLTVTDGEFDASKQINDVKSLLQRDVDAILTSPVQSDAGVTMVEDAAAENVPVFTANSTAATDQVPLFTAFGNADAATTAADAMADEFEEQLGSPEGTVVEVLLPQNSETFVQRHEGFQEGMSEYDDIEIISQIEYDQTQEDAVNKITTQLQKNDDFDAIYCPDLLSGLAAMTAFENAGVKKPAGEEGHIITTGLDAGPATLKAISNGFYDAAIDQPNLFYAPISMKYMVDYLDAGKESSAIPDTGQEITADGLTISTGNEHAGIDPWKKPLWSPAQVTEQEFDGGSQTYFKTSQFTVTKENVDVPYIWGNLGN